MNTRVAIGRISGVFGVRGWVKVFSYTSPRVNVVNYSPWWLRQDGVESTRQVLAGKAHGDGVVVSLEGITDRDAAAAVIGAEIEVERAVLGPELREQAPALRGSAEFFWVDLQGMEVRSKAGVSFGCVDHLFETGANDVMVVVGKGRYLIPFICGSADPTADVVKSVDGDNRVITVDWDPDF